jgi:hypothetical protein
MTDDRNSIRISRSAVHNSAIGIGEVTLHHTEAAARGLADLRTALATQADGIIGLGRDNDERDELRHELRKIRQELEHDTPDGVAVRTRWKSVLAVLGTALASSAHIAQITELVVTVFAG